MQKLNVIAKISC